MHIPEGQLKAYLDCEVPEPARQQLADHLAGCVTCQGRLADLVNRAGQVTGYLASLPAPPPEGSASLYRAHARLQARISEKESSTMFQKIFARQYRPIWAVLVIVALLGGALALPGVRAIANSFLGLFRVEQITIVPVNGDAPEQLVNSKMFETMISKDLQTRQIGTNQKTADAAEASALVGYPLRLPAGTALTANFQVSSGMVVTATVDLPQVKALLKEINRPDIQLPDNLDGAQVVLNLPQSVTAQYGNCSHQQPAGGDPDSPDTPWYTDCTTLTQVPSPTISAPPGLDITQIGEAFLEVMGMSPSQAAQLSSTVDWSTTLVLPLPTNYGASYQDVVVDGVNGTLVRQSYMTRSGQPVARTTLLWVKDGMVYLLEAPNNTAAALEVANSLR
jgi:hypothetical protein